MPQEEVKFEIVASMEGSMKKKKEGKKGFDQRKCIVVGRAFMYFDHP
jgi:hypothetical protein